MGGLIEPSPVAEECDRSKRTIVIAIAVVVAVAGAIALLLREKPRAVAAPPPYAASLKFSDLKMSQAQNFVGASVTYVDGTLSNTGDKTVTRAIVRVTFQDAYSQVAQIENLPIRLLRTNGPYPDTLDLASAPLAPGKSELFRLTFEHLSEQWNQAYPGLQIIDVTLQ
jgi:hypothetical protein